MTLRVGTSGWAYPEWQPAFYPLGLPRARFLEHYASELGMCEVNATFYRVQSEGAVAGWASAVGPDFRFVCKAHRAITHSRDLGAASDVVERFLASLAPLGSHLAGVLAQVPAWRANDAAWLDMLLTCLRPAGTVVVEFDEATPPPTPTRHLIADAGGSVCLTHTDGPPPVGLPPGPLAYVRLRAASYSAHDRAQWAELFRREAASRQVYAVGRHKDLPPDDPYAGLGLARWFARERPPTTLDPNA